MTQVQPADGPAAMVQRPGGPRILALDCFDVRFPTSREHHGSDAMNPDPDYSAAYVVLRTDPGAPDGHAICFTIGRGNDIVVTAVEALRPHLVGRPVADIVTDLGGRARRPGRFPLHRRPSRPRWASAGCGRRG
jgi:L-fuconate dehydratase